MQQQVLFIDCGCYKTKSAILKPNHVNQAIQVSEIPTLLALGSNSYELNQQLPLIVNESIQQLAHFDITKQDLQIESKLQVSQAVKFWNAILRKIRHHDSLQQLAHGSATDRRLMLAINQSMDNQKKFQVTQQAFETLNCKQFYIANTGALTLYSQLCTTGVAVDLGHGHSQITPVCNGFVQRQSSIDYQFCGYELSEYLIDMVENQSANSDVQLQKPNGMPDFYAIQAVKHTKKATNLEKTQYCMIPNGKLVKFPVNWNACLSQHYTNPIAFKNYYEGRGHYSLQKESLIREIMNAVERYLKLEKEDHNVFDTVVFAGGQVGMEGLVPTLKEGIFNEFSDRYSLMEPIFVEKEPERAVLRGASLFVGMGNDAMNSLMVSKSQYLENGASIIKKKCF